MSFRSLIHRIRWGSVIAVCLLLAVIYATLISIPPGYHIGGDIGIWADASPDVIGASEASRINVELKNMKSDEPMLIVLKAITHDENLIFEDTYAQTYQSEPISIGPNEVRKLGFKVMSRPKILPGEYRIRISAEEVGNEEAARTQKSVSIKVKSPDT